MGDVDVPVGGFIIFSGSTAHAGKLPFTVMVPLRFAVAGLGLSLYSSLTLWFLQDLDTISVIVDYIFIFAAQTPGKKALHLS